MVLTLGLSASAKEKEWILSECIRDKNWFGYSWDSDPTVKSALKILDTFEEKIPSSKRKDYIKNFDMIKFFFLNLGDYGMTDKLYIKMNDRGKKLSDFDFTKSTFSGDVFDIYKDSTISNDKWDSCFDNNWMDCFWRFCFNTQKIFDEPLIEESEPEQRKILIRKETVNRVEKTYSYFINYQPKKCYLPDYVGYNSLYSFNIMKNENRNRAGIELIKYLNKHNIKTLVLFSKIDKHGLVIQKQLYDEGVKSLFLCGGETIYEFDGKKKPEKRKGDVEDIKEALKKDYNIILGYSVFFEGIDISDFDCGLLFGGGKSPISLVQANGRVARKKKHDLNVSIMVDFKDIGGHYIFQHQYEKRRQILRSNGVKNFEKVQDFMNMILKIEESKEKYKNSSKEEN